MKQRIVTGLIAAVVFLTLLYLGNYWFMSFIGIASIIGFYEFVKMNGFKPFSLTSIIGYVAVVLLCMPWTITSWPVLSSVTSIIWFFLFILLFITVISKNKVTIDQVSVLFLGVVYIGLGFHYMIETRMIEQGGLFWTLLIFFCIWATDSGAYFVGSKFGKHPLWPAISPKKSIEGSLGGIIISIVVALCFSWAQPELLSWTQALLLGIAIAIVGQIGDLIQSAYKRVKGIKDTGTILPGHGGVLDRVDSWIIVFPMVHLLLLLPHA
ncbi:phosphatidate cytidylyltransferase [Paenibacillus agricola]|uniref:Phosphatidate cytidylyltransferase n=1 Tax=Paenibacillus agricola TaxID=2716264 RepID=A0ABX0J0B7_9BACL|nr:phosphatidate cytidylyltransferase [Paenibacillus agricola]NHN28347.1 phosphatidate cytidylyltransferase [Paenibacillus agricola]